MLFLNINNHNYNLRYLKNLYILLSFSNVPSGPDTESLSKYRVIIVVTASSFCIRTQLFTFPSEPTEKKFNSPSGRSGAHFI